MDFEVAERRAKHRFPPPAAVSLHVTMRPGCRVVLVDVTEQGALIEAPRPLRPGATIQLTVMADAARYAIAARVLRCTVAVLDPTGGVTYRGGLAFEAPVRWPWAVITHERTRPHGHQRPNRSEAGNRLPGPDDPPSAVTEGFTK
jgi:hypothetical protein